jgi:hypothetical protein
MGKRSEWGVEAWLAVAVLVYTAAGAAYAWGSFGALLEQYAATHFRALPPMLAAGLVGASVALRPRAPLSFMLALVRRRGAGAAATIALFCLGIAAFSTFKHHLPAWVPFFADRPLADLDELLHLGQPWRWAHAVAPEGAGAVLAFLYGPVWFGQWLGFVLVAAFLTRDRLRARYLVALAATLVLLGTVGRVAGASAGPIFYDRMFGGERFADLLEALGASPWGAAMLAASDYLYASYRADDAVFGSGISAMPSIHVAIAVLNALFLRAFNRWLGLAGCVYAGAILFGSVYFGWHYALDGYASILGVLAIWRLAGWSCARENGRADAAVRVRVPALRRP